MTLKQNNSLLLSAMLVCAIVASEFATGSAQSRKPKTVGDFYLLIPQVYVDRDVASRKQLLGSGWPGLIVDTRNGYISYDESDNSSGFEFAIFRKNNGSYLVAYSNGAFSDIEWSRESGNWPVLHLLSYEHGRWREVKSSVLPVPFNKKLAYLLPREGKSIQVSDMEKGRKLYTLTWRNDRFHKRPVTRK